MDERKVKKVMAHVVRETIAILPDKNIMEEMLLKLEAKINETVLDQISKATKPLYAKIEKLELKHYIYKAHSTGIEQKLDDAEQKLDDTAQCSRRVCLRIYGIPLPKALKARMTASAK